MTGDSLLCGEGFLGVLPSSSSHNRSPTLGVEVLEARFHNYFPPLQSGKKAWLEFHLGLSLGRLRDLAYIKSFKSPCPVPYYHLVLLSYPPPLACVLLLLDCGCPS